MTKDVPSPNDIKDGLLRMIFLADLEDVGTREKAYNRIQILKFTTGAGFSKELLNKEDREILRESEEEA